MSSPFTRAVGHLLAEERRSRGLSQAEVAEAINVGARLTVRKYEQDARGLSLGRLVGLCTLYDLTPSAIVTHADTLATQCVVDTRIVAGCDDPTVGVLGKWAARRLATDTADPIVVLSHDVVRRWASAQGVDPGSLVSALACCRPSFLVTA